SVARNRRGYWPRQRCTTSPRRSGSHCHRCRRGGTARWSPPSATPCIASAARIGRHTKALSRRSRPWTSPNSCDSPVFESTCGADHFEVAGGSVPPVCSLFVSTAVAQHGEGDSPTPDRLIGQTDPALSLGWDGELVVQVLQMLFDGCLCDE